MDSSTEKVLIQRLDRLERENVWLKRVGGAAALVLLALVALGTDAIRGPRQIAAQKFILNDPSGRPRAELAMGLDGGPALHLLDRKGQDQVVLRAAGDGTSNLEYYENHALRASLANVTGIGASVNLYNRGFRGRAEMFMTEDGSSGVSFNRDRRSVGMNLQTDGTAKVRLTDRDGKERAGMLVGPDGTQTHLSKTDRPRSGYAEAAAPPSIPVPVVPPKIRRVAEPAEEAGPLPAGGTLGRRTFGAP